MSLDRWFALAALGASVASALAAVGAITKQSVIEYRRERESDEAAASAAETLVRARTSTFAQNDENIKRRQQSVLERAPPQPMLSSELDVSHEGSDDEEDPLSQISPGDRLLSPRSVDEDVFEVEKDLSLYDYYDQDDYEDNKVSSSTSSLPASLPQTEKYVGFSALRPKADADKRFFNPAPALDYVLSNNRLLSDWNRRFRNCLHKVRKLEATSTLAHRYDANLEIMHLAQDFIHAATTYGKIIIAEYFLPVEQRTIKPVRLGGLMGGQKYVVHNILFKFATDDNGLFGSDYAAAKVAGNELRGLISYFNCKIEPLHLPLMALVDYRGFRLVAMSILPINKTTIVYGSCDAGRNIHTNRNPQINKFIAEAASKMNLKPHHCRIARSRGDYIYREHRTANGESLRVRVPAKPDEKGTNPVNGEALPASGTPNPPTVLLQVPISQNINAPWLSPSTPPAGLSLSTDSESSLTPGYGGGSSASGYDAQLMTPPARRRNVPPEFLPQRFTSSSAPIPKRHSPRPSNVPSLQLSSSSSPESSRASISSSSSHSRSNSYNTQALNLTKQQDKHSDDSHSSSGGKSKSNGRKRGKTTISQSASKISGYDELSGPAKMATDVPQEDLSEGEAEESIQGDNDGTNDSLSGSSVYFTQITEDTQNPTELPRYNSDTISQRLSASGYDTRVAEGMVPEPKSALKGSDSQSRPVTEELCSPADLEGHLGLDGRFYLLDFSRTQPPELPNKNFKNSHLSRLLRPEFVRKYFKPLCSDAFSGFIKGTPGEKDHNADIEEATHHLVDVTVPKFARELELSMAEAREQGRLNKFRVTEFAHSHGINCRHFGRLRRELRDPDFRRLVLLEMIARCIKNNLRWKLREKMKLITLPLEEPYRRLVIDYFNLVFGNTKLSEDYWNVWLKKDLEVNFVDSLLDTELTPAFNLKKGYSNMIDDDFLYLLFERVTHMMGMTWGFGPSRTSNFLGERPFDDTDLEAVGERVKHMNIIAHAHGYFYHLKGLAIRIDDPLGAQKFYEIAIEKFEDALNTDPNNKEILLSMALTHMLAIEDIYQNVPNARFLPSDQRVMKAEEYCLRAIYAEPKYDSFSLFRYAQFLEKCDRLEAAEDYYLMALEADPNNAGCLHCYGQLLTDRGDHDLAEEFFKRASANTVGLKQWPQWYH